MTKVAFSRDGSRVAITRKDGIILLWDWEKTPPRQTDDNGVRRVRDYLENNPNFDESDRQLCDDVPKVVAKDKSF